MLKNKPRVFLIGIISAAAAAVLLLMHFYGFAKTFSFWNVRTYGIPFLDLRLITGTFATLRQGGDPAVSNPGDPLQRVFNYPKIWYLILASGLNENWTSPLGALVIGLFVVSVCVFPGRLTGWSVWFLTLAMVSPAVMLAFARVNIDMLMFALMTLSLALVATRELWSLIVLVIVILLKIIPVLGLGTFLEADQKRSIKYMAATLVFTAAYFVFTWNDMVFIFTHTQRGYEEAYGLAVLPALVQAIAHSPVVRAGPGLFYGVASAVYDLSLSLPEIPYFAAGALLVLALFAGWRRRVSTDGANPRNLRAFRMGALLYVGTFFVGNNWEYRLIFLLFTLPQLADWTTSTHRLTKFGAIVTLAALFTSLWHLLLRLLLAELFSLGAFAFDLMNQGANWLLFACLAYLFSAALPDWLYVGPDSLRNQVRRALPWIQANA